MRDEPFIPEWRKLTVGFCINQLSTSTCIDQICFVQNFTVQKTIKQVGKKARRKIKKGRKEENNRNVIYLQCSPKLAFIWIILQNSTVKEPYTRLATFPCVQLHLYPGRQTGTESLQEQVGKYSHEVVANSQTLVAWNRTAISPNLISSAHQKLRF